MKINKGIILAAGEGMRLRTINRYKPIVKINGTPLFELTFKNLQFENFEKVVTIFNEDEKEMNLRLLPSLNQKNVSYFFKSTPSSMHSLYEVSRKFSFHKGEHIFVSMVDSIVKENDAINFHFFCHSLNPDESAIIVTPFIDDEQPLTLKVNSYGYVTEFQCAIGEDVFVTSGVYCFSEEILHLLAEMIQAGQTKMRNFLSELVQRGHKIKVFQIAKTLDIDRPQDIVIAEAFLQENVF